MEIPDEAWVQHQKYLESEFRGLHEALAAKPCVKHEEAIQQYTGDRNKVIGALRGVWWAIKYLGTPTAVIGTGWWAFLSDLFTKKQNP